VTVRPTKATVSGLAHSPHRSKFVLKGGVLLAAYGLRRPTTDIDGAALQTSNQAEDIRQFVVAVASTALPADLDDGLRFDLDSVTAEAIRDEDKYGGVRIRLVARLASAREPFHVDVGIGDPIWPGPAEISLPRLLGQEPIQLRGYPTPTLMTYSTGMQKSASRGGPHGGANSSSPRLFPNSSVTLSTR
jgi:Nucleotidyl transferase AbiEii toxin, Type IV TA system